MPLFFKYFCSHKNKLKRLSHFCSAGAQNIQIIEYPKNQSAFINSSLTFNCTATGHPRPTISWVKNDDPYALQTNPRVEEKVILLDNKTVRSQLLLTGTKMEDIGKYNCVANNSAGERVSRVSSLFTEDLGKRHSFFAPENDNLFSKTVQIIYPKSSVTMSRLKKGYETKLPST